MPFLQPASSPHGVKVPKSLLNNQPAISASSSSSSPSLQQPRSRTRPVSNLHNLEYPEPLRIRRSANTTTTLPSPSPRPRPPKPPQPLPTIEPSISTPLPPTSAPYQRRRLQISPIPLRPRLTPPSKERPVDSAHRKSDPKTLRTANLLIKRKSIYHITNEPATPTLPLGNHVSVRTESTPPPPKSSSHFLSIPLSPIRDEKKPLIQDNFDTDAILPAPLDQTLAKRKDLLPIYQSPSLPSKRRRTEIKRKLTVTRRTISSLLPWKTDPLLKQDLQVIDEKLRMTAQAVDQSGEKWRRYATFLPTRSEFDGFQETTRVALREALENHGDPGKRVGESLGVVESEDEDGDEVEVQDTVDQIVAIRNLTLGHLRSRRRVDMSR